MKPYLFIRYCIAFVWLINGLFCKLLNLVPRHQLIVQAILQTNHAAIITKAIGIGEIVMFVWSISSYKPRMNAIFQILIIAVMNVLEFILVPDLLLWGKGNAIFAFLLILLIGLNEFAIKSKNVNHNSHVILP